MKPRHLSGVFWHIECLKRVESGLNPEWRLLAELGSPDITFQCLLWRKQKLRYDLSVEVTTQMRHSATQWMSNYAVEMNQQFL